MAGIRHRLKSLSVTDVVYLVSGAFVVTCYAAYLATCLYRLLFSASILPVVVISMVVIPFAFRKFWKKLLKKFYLPLKVILCAGMCFYMITFSIFSTVILTQDDTVSDAERGSQTCVVVVFGCHTNGWTPSITLAGRLKKAAAVLNDIPDAICIVSGAQGSNESVRESTSMKQYLINEFDIAEERILEEPNANNTYENLKYSTELANAEGYADAHIICVSSEFHTPRIHLLAGRAGYDVETASSSSVSLPSLFSNLVREYMAYVKLFIFGTE